MTDILRQAFFFYCWLRKSSVTTQYVLYMLWIRNTWRLNDLLGEAAFWNLKSRGQT